MLPCHVTTPLDLAHKIFATRVLTCDLFLSVGNILILISLAVMTKIATARPKIKSSAPKADTITTTSAHRIKTNTQKLFRNCRSKTLSWENDVNITGPWSETVTSLPAPLQASAALTDSLDRITVCFIKAPTAPLILWVTLNKIWLATSWANILQIVIILSASHKVGWWHFLHK